MSFIINCHTHLFTFYHVPVRFIFGQRLLASTKAGRSRLAFALFRLNPWNDYGKLDRLAVFIQNGNVDTQAEIYDRLSIYYPSSARFVVHSIDFDYMGAGRSPIPFLGQLKELAELKRIHPKKIYPFVCADPRRPKISSLVRQYIEKKGFAGIKLYPAMGFFPFDERLYPLYEYAQEYQIPIMTHCSCSGPVFGRNIPPKKERFHPKTGAELIGKNKRHFADHYSTPENYFYLLKDFPRLKICFAHFGGDAQCKKYYKSNELSEVRDNWFVQVSQLLRSYPNTYADISYSAANFDLLALFNALLQSSTTKHKILFGSDFYMSNIERNERWFSMNVLMHLGEERYMQIAHTNAIKYLENFL